MRRRELERRIASLETLGETISAMKSLSAHHFRLVRAAVEPAAQYRQGVEEIARRLGARLEAGRGPVGLVLVGAELGLCGPYNAELSRALRARREQLGQGPTYCIGRRAATLLERRQVTLRRRYASPTGSSGTTQLLLQLSRDVLADYRALDLSAVEVVSSRFEGIGARKPRTTRLLPLAPQGEGPPVAVRYASPQRMLGVAVREVLYCTLYDLLIEGLACEHAARLLATQAAEQWIERTAQRSRRQLTASRREASTQEVIEISSGARARQTAVMDRASRSR